MVHRAHQKTSGAPTVERLLPEGVALLRTLRSAYGRSDAVEEARIVDEHGHLQQPTRRSKPKIKFGCYQFEGEDGLFCIRCYETQARRHPTTRVNSSQRQCAVCQTVVHA
jgi:hypothetical protein